MPITDFNAPYLIGTSSAWGVFDADNDYITDSVKIYNYVIRSLGFPIVNLQFNPQHIFTAFQSAIMKYSTIVNEAKIADHLLSVYGSSPSQDLTKAGIMSSLSSIFQISSMYGQESIIRSSKQVEIYTASVTVTPQVQEYDLRDWIPQYTNSNVQIVQIYHYPRMYNTAVYDPMINPGFNMASVMNQFGGVYANNARLVIMPVFETLLKMQALQFSQQIRRSHYGFELRKNKLIIYPQPLQQTQIAIDYLLRSDKYANSIKEDVVNNISNFPIKDYIMYTDINIPGRNWIQRFTLALAKEILGMIRSKYDTIPYPQGEASLDGQTLRQQATTQQDKLVEQLKFILQQSSLHRMIEKKKDMSENIQIINSKSPMPIYIG